MSDRDLKTYLNDHDLGSVAGVRLAKVCASQNRGTPLGAFALRLLKNLESDRVLLQEVLDRLGASRAPLKKGVGLVTGVASQLKLRRPGAKSSLGRFETVEGLVVAINGRRALWRTLEIVAEKDGRLRDLPFNGLALRAKQDLEEAEAHRLACAREAFLTPRAERPARRRPLILQRG